MVEHRLEAHDDDVRIDHFLGKAQHVDGRQHHRAGDDQLQDVLARAGHPVHAFDAVVHRVQSPQQRHLVVGAVRPVLHQVGHQNDEEQRHPEVQPLHPAANAIVGGPAKELVHDEVGGQQHKAHHHVVHDEVMKVRLPLGAEHGLVFAVRKQLFNEDEDERAAQQIQDEPVQANVGRVVREVRVHLYLVPTQQGCQGHHGEGERCQPPGAVEQDVDQRDTPRNGHGRQHDGADDVHVVALAQLGRGEVLRKVKRQHAQQAQNGQRERDDA